MDQSNHHLLIVEDEIATRHLLSDTFEAEGYKVTSVESIAEAQAILGRIQFDVVLLDLLLSDGHGLDLLPACRQSGPTGVIILTVCGARDERLSGLGLGADDYVVKPFDIEELLLRVRNLAIRTAKGKGLQAGETGSVVACRFGPWQVELATRRLLHESGDVKRLTRSEFYLLSALIAQPETVVDRPTLLTAIGHSATVTNDRAVDGLVLRLRRKFGESTSSERYIVSCRGAGYRFNLPVRWLRQPKAEPSRRRDAATQPTMESATL